MMDADYCFGSFAGTPEMAIKATKLKNRPRMNHDVLSRFFSPAMKAQNDAQIIPETMAIAKRSPYSSLESMRKPNRES